MGKCSAMSLGTFETRWKSGCVILNMHRQEGRQGRGYGMETTHSGHYPISPLPLNCCPC